MLFLYFFLFLSLYIYNIYIYCFVFSISMSIPVCISISISISIYFFYLYLFVSIFLSIYLCLWVCPKKLLDLRWFFMATVCSLFFTYNPDVCRWVGMFFLILLGYVRTVIDFVLWHQTSPIPKLVGCFALWCWHPYAGTPQLVSLLPGVPGSVACNWWKHP